MGRFAMGVMDGSINHHTQKVTADQAFARNDREYQKGAISSQQYSQNSQQLIAKHCLNAPLPEYSKSYHNKSYESNYHSSSK